MTFLAGQVLTASQLETETNNKPACSVSHSTTQNITTAGSPKVVSADTEAYDWSITAMHSTAVNTSRVTCQQAGIYGVTIRGGWQSNAAGRRVIELWKNGVQLSRLDDRAAHAAGENVQSGVARNADLAVGDYVECRAFQDSGSTLTFQLYELSVEYIRD